MSRSVLLKAIAGTVADYRVGEVDPVTPDRIDAWVKQFDSSVQIAILAELEHALAKSYVSGARFEAFVAEVLTAGNLVGDDPCAFWSGANIMTKQKLGGSQQELLARLEPLLQAECGLSLNDCGSAEGPFIYLDDAVYTGMHLLNDVSAIVATAPAKTTLYVIVIGLHTQGAAYAGQQIKARFRDAGKQVEIAWGRLLELENTVARRNNSDVLWPSSIPADPMTQAYVQSLGHKPILRQGSGLGGNKLFSSADARHLLEREFLKSGAMIRSQSPYLTTYMRPLGNSVLETLGFGSLLVTFRNCANNCPLVWWASGPWLPLFQRKTNKKS